jgi:uncharacterized protein YfaS (alpha-2-macroglobulin family)
MRRRHLRINAWICLWAALASVTAGCPGSQQARPLVPHAPAAAIPMTPPAHGRAEVALSSVIAGDLGISPLTAVADATAGVTTSDLSRAETEALYARMEPLPALDTGTPPVMRAPSPRPPGPGAIQPIAFVAPAGTSVVDKPIQATPPSPPRLEPPQILPIGEVLAESQIRVRFAEPMIAVEHVGEAKAEVATIEPAVRGTWRWLDTRVAEFTAQAPRLAQATPYKVTVASAKALSGAVLDEPVTGTFATPPISIEGLYPNRNVRPDAPIAVMIDQDFDEAQILERLVVRAGKRPIAVTRTTLAAAQALWAKNPSFVFEPRELGSRYTLIAPPSGGWPAAATIDITLPKGAPSREGPRLSEHASKRSFTVAPAFVVRGIDCGWWGTAPKLTRTCPALSTVDVAFSNPLDEKAFRAEMVQLAGQPLHDHTARGAEVTLLLPDVVGRTFTVAFASELRDMYGQMLAVVPRAAVTTSRYVYQPYLWAQTGLYVLDPRFHVPQWVVDSQAVTSMRVELYQVQPADYFAFSEFELGKRATPPGKRVWAKDFVVGERYAGEARVDLRPALAAGSGHVVAVATAIPARPVHKNDGFEKRITAWIQVSKLGLTSRVDRERVHTWVSDISPGAFLAPRGDATASLVIMNQPVIAAHTGATGEATLELPPSKAPKPVDDWNLPPANALVVATAGTDSVFAAIDREGRSERVRNALWYVTDDRFTYKPNEPVYVKGWVRWTHDGVNPGLELPAAGDALAYEAYDSKHDKIASGTVTLSDQGGFDFQFDVPETANLGTARIELHTKQQSYTHSISIQEFRTPAFAVNLDDDVWAKGTTPLIAGEAIDMTAEATYYAGGGLAGARLAWEARLEPGAYRPPGWDLFTFAPARKRSEAYRSRAAGGVTVAEVSALGTGSSAGLRLALHAVPANEPAVLSVDATVTDVDRQTIRATSRTILVHPAALYVGMRLEPLTDDELQVVVTDIDGKAVAGVPVDVQLDATLYSEAHKDDAKIHDSKHCTVTSAAAPVVCRLGATANWQFLYRAVATVRDARGRTNTAAYFVPNYHPPDDKAPVSITADKPSYRAGDTAKLDIRSDTVPATAIVSFARQGVIAQRRVAITTPVTRVEVPIEVGYLENLHVQVDRVAKRDPRDDKHPEPLPGFAEAYTELRIDREGSRLDIRARSTKPIVQPGADATFEVDITHAGAPVANAEVALIVVDEAVLALSERHHEDPLALFYREVEAGTVPVDTFNAVLDEDDHLDGLPGSDRYNLDEGGRGFGTGSGYGSGFGTIGHGSGTGSGYGVGSTVVAARKDFRATAIFAPHLHTDARGHVTVSVKMPESLTRFRVVALATAQSYWFGKGEGTVLTQRSVNARTQAPRFLAQGDRFDLPVVVQNLDKTARTISVAVRAANLAGGGGKRVTVPAGQRAEVRFPFATAARGKAVIQTIVVAGDSTDASNVTVPVYAPATTETFATYGVVDDAPAYEQLKVPSEIFADVGGFETEVSSTQLQALTDAFGYLNAYPFECAEQRSSRMLGTAAMRDVLDAFAAPGRPTPQQLADQHAIDVKKLVADQNADGGWGYWRDTPTDPFVTMQVVQALVVEKVRGATVTKATAFITKLLAKTTAKLQRAERGPGRGDEVSYDVSLAATALAALAAIGRDERGAAEALHATAERIAVYPVDAKARLLALVAKQPGARAMRTQLVAELVSAAHETAAGAVVATHFTEGERLLLGSDNRSTALALDALIREDAKQPLIAKLARGLLAARAHGRWRSTQENLVVMQAMRRYFDTYEKDVPNYTGKLWIGDVAYAEHAFAGRTNVRATARLDWKQLAPGSTHAVAIQKQGPGRMYYRIGITYAPKRVDLPALDAGFVVRRSYEPIDHTSDVTTTATGVHIKLGARVQVVDEVVVTTRRDGVALVDPLPAGLEAVNTSLATSERAAGNVTRSWDHVEMRDERSEAFASTLAAGAYRFAFTARATTPGTFTAAPAKAEEMYSPETFGRSAGTTVTIY